MVVIRCYGLNGLKAHIVAMKFIRNMKNCQVLQDIHHLDNVMVTVEVAKERKKKVKLPLTRLILAQKTT